MLSALFSGLLWLALHNQIDHHIHIVTTQAEQVVNNFAGNEKELLLNNLVHMEGMSILLIGNDGEVILEKRSSDITPLSSQEVQQIVFESEKIGQHPIHFTIHGQRFGSATVEVNGQPALLAVGYSLRILTDTFFQMVGIVLGVITFTLPLLAYFGHRLLMKYLHPLEVIAETAQQITTPRKLSHRVTELASTREVSAIVSSFNEMLGRLEGIFKTEHEFFSDAAHTLKTPLAVLRAKVEGLTKEGEIRKKEMLRVIDSAVDTVQDLLLISRIETGTVGPVKKVNISKVVDELGEIAVSLAEDKQVTMTKDIGHNIFLLADERLIKKAFGNVVHNAVQYVNERGSISLKLEASAEKIVFRVTNSGGRIPKNELAQVFERFYRGTNSHKNTEGSGLGLAITKAVVESYKGRIKLEMDQAGNVVVKIWFPEVKTGSLE